MADCNLRTSRRNSRQKGTIAPAVVGTAARKICRGIASITLSRRVATASVRMDYLCGGALVASNHRIHLVRSLDIDGDWLELPDDEP